MTVNLQVLNEINKEISFYKKSKLLIVTKNQSCEDIAVLLESGYRHFGENRVQEATLKYSLLRQKYKNFHLDLIGPLQTNKVKQALICFDRIQTLDRKKLIDEILKTQKKNKENLRTQTFFIQVNIGNENQKFGIHPDDLETLYNYASNLGIKIDGLMCIPPSNQDPSKFFKEMNQIRNYLNKNLYLSMGMSSDYLIALKHDSDLIRIGSKIFN